MQPSFASFTLICDAPEYSLAEERQKCLIGLPTVTTEEQSGYCKVLNDEKLNFR